MGQGTDSTDLGWRQRGEGKGGNGEGAGEHEEMILCLLEQYTFMKKKMLASRLMRLNIVYIHSIVLIICSSELWFMPPVVCAFGWISLDIFSNALS